MNRKLSIIILAISLVVVGYVVSGASLTRGQEQDSVQDVPYRQMNVYQEVLEYVDRDYVTTPNLSSVTDGALHGLLESLDPDSSYMDPTEYRAYLQDEKAPEKGALGLVVTKRFGYAAIVDVAPGSPAAHAGLGRGDFLEAIGGQGTRDLSLPAIRSLLRGAPGTTAEVSAVLQHRVEPKKILLTRVMLPAAPLIARLYGADIAYIAVPDLNAGRAAEIAAQIRALSARGATKFVLDLRNCGTGDDAEAEKTANLFLNHGSITYLQGQRYPRQTVTASPAAAVTSAPVAVLVNTGTFGSSEIVAAAILGNHRGNVVGDRTFGEGSVQKVITLDDGAAVLLSVARYYSPDGIAIQGHGVTPDVQQVEYAGALPQDDVPPEGVAPNGQDLQLQRALQLMGGKATAAAAPAPAPQPARVIWTMAQPS